jgi:hypothetical protein
MYVSVIEPFIAKYEEVIDSYYGSGQQGVRDVRQEYKKDISEGFNTIKTKATQGFATFSKKAMEELQASKNNETVDKTD